MKSKKSMQETKVENIHTKMLADGLDPELIKAIAPMLTKYDGEDILKHISRHYANLAMQKKATAQDRVRLQLMAAVIHRMGEAVGYIDQTISFANIKPI